MTLGEQPGRGLEAALPLRSGPMYGLDDILISHIYTSLDEGFKGSGDFSSLERIKEAMFSGRAIAQAGFPQMTDIAIAAALIQAGIVPEIIEPDAGYFGSEDPEDIDILATDTINIFAGLGVIPDQDYSPEEFEFIRGAEQQHLVDLMGEGVVRDEVERGGTEYIRFSKETDLLGISVAVGFIKDIFGRPSASSVSYSGRPRVGFFQINLSPEAYVATFPTEPTPDSPRAS